MLIVENEFMRNWTNFKAVMDMLSGGRLHSSGRCYKLSGKWQFKIESDKHYANRCLLLHIT